ncbi:cytochrome d ubiquinol oxidase subunit II [Segeticoccus rhizosphaerae]|uniref:cytochrome d ubiquinol oxidase subunit II n=1 Tax=Segeticoccus rhizosphaerae TaxID=1104777 RepID=UPI0010C119D1|nr:cytochrome d ubiquinol oxidase subunit II [Ornithinicoccus soli]
MDLTTLWFILIAVLWTGYFVLEGFDFGVGMLLPVLGRDETRRRMMLNTIGPVWDGNEVWLITAAGATFAAFPHWYATLFSGFYLPMLLILVALIVRALGFDYRGKRDDPLWRARWDRAIVFGSVVPAFGWGAILTTMVHGVAIDATGELTGSPLLVLANPYGLLGGLTTVALFLTHGALFVALKTDGDVRHAARSMSLRTGAVALALTTLSLVTLGAGRASGISWSTSALAVVALASGLLAASRRREGWAFAGTFVAIGAVVASLFLTLWPEVMPSSLVPAWSLTAAEASSTAYTLTIMTWVALVFTPLVVLYQGYTYWVFRRRIQAHHIPAPVPFPVER